MSESTSEDRQSDVSLRVPADTAYVAVLRTTAAGLAARVDFTLDDIEDLRMAVSEASALVLPAASEGGHLTGDFHLGSSSIRIEVGVDSTSPVAPETDSFAWQVLTTLADDVTSTTQNGRLMIALSMQSTASDHPAPTPV